MIHKITPQHVIPVHTGTPEWFAEIPLGDGGVHVPEVGVAITLG